MTMWVTLIFVWLLTGLFSIIRLKWFIKRRSKRHSKPSVLFLECNYRGNAGYVYRTTRWVEILRENGHQADSWSILKKEFYLYDFETDSDKFKFHFSILFLRLAQCLNALKYDIIIIRRELLMYNDYGNLFLERFLLSAHPNLIYDFDDDIGASKREQRKISLFGKLNLETRNKFTWYLKNFKNFIPGSNYLDSLVYARRYGKPYHKLVVPTLVDYNKVPPRKYSSHVDKVTLGWIGGGYNLLYLADIIEDLNALSEKYALNF